MPRAAPAGWAPAAHWISKAAVYKNSLKGTTNAAEIGELPFSEKPKNAFVDLFLQLSCDRPRLLGPSCVIGHLFEQDVNHPILYTGASQTANLVTSRWAQPKTVKTPEI